jgi:tellurite resistance protein TerC
VVSVVNTEHTLPAEAGAFRASSETTTRQEAVVLIWISFIAFVFVLLALDLGVFHRRARIVSVREALSWTIVWIATALVFAGFVYLGYDRHWLGMGLTPDPVDRSALYPDGRVNDARSAALKFVTGYLVELSLSADNVFVIALLFGYFAIPRIYQHRVLFWGILGALLMRGTMIAIGAQLVSEFSWILPAFGAVLIVTAAKMLFTGGEPINPENTFVMRLLLRVLPVTNRFEADRFFVKNGSAWLLTPLAPALVMVETTDLVFAVDSIPAIFAITADPFLVFTSNVFAILGLRSLYFALAGALHVLPYLRHAMAIVLVTVGVKMLAHSWLEHALGPNFNLYLLAAVVLILGAGVLASLIAVRWREGLLRVTHSAAGALDRWIVPDHLMTTITRAAERAAPEQPESANEEVKALSARAPWHRRLWWRLVRGHTHHVPIVVFSQMLEDVEICAIFI